MNILRLVSYTKTQISLKRSGTNVHTKQTCVEDASTHPFILTSVSMMLCLCLFPFTPSNQSPEWTIIFLHCCLSLQSCSYPACFFSPVPVFTGEHCISIAYETLSAPSPAQSLTVSGSGSVLSNDLEVGKETKRCCAPESSGTGRTRWRTLGCCLWV